MYKLKGRCYDHEFVIASPMSMIMAAFPLVGVSSDVIQLHSAMITAFPLVEYVIKLSAFDRESLSCLVLPYRAGSHVVSHNAEAT